MDANEAERRMRRFSRRVNSAMDEIGVEPVLEVLEDAVDEILAGGGRSGNRRGRPPPVVLAGQERNSDDDGPGPRPRRAEYRTKKAHRAALKEWQKKRAEREGPATRRGCTPPIVTRGPDN